ncbi:hypothetical protein AB5N19_14033 [Seiridium cardinale]
MTIFRALSAALVLAAISYAQSFLQRDEYPDTTVTIATTVFTTICPVSTYSAPGGQTIISSGSIIIINYTDTITLPSVTSQYVLTTDDITLTLIPQASPTITTVINGQTVISNAGSVVIGGTDTVIFPSVSSRSELFTHGITFTLFSSSTDASLTITEGSTDQPTGTDASSAVQTASTLPLGTDGQTIPIKNSNQISSTAEESHPVTVSTSSTGMMTGTEGLPATSTTTIGAPSSGGNGDSTINPSNHDIPTFPASGSGFSTSTQITSGAGEPTSTVVPVTIITTILTGTNGISAPITISTVLAPSTSVITGPNGQPTTVTVVPPVSTSGGAVTSSAGAPSTSNFPADSFSIPTGTLPSGAEETGYAADAVPILYWLYDHADWLENDAYRDQFIEELEKSRDDIVGLFNSFTDNPEPRPECRNTSMKRSLISAIFDLFKSVADLVSCAIQVLENLVKITNNITNMPLDQVKLLTETLRDIADEINKKKNEPTMTSSQPSTSSTSSCTTTITVTWESVFCTVTASSGQARRQDGGCSTSAFSTITDCDPTPMTSTVTTTVIPVPTEVLDEDCGFGSCAGAACAISAREVLDKRRKYRNTQPAICKWADSSNYAPPTDFMAGEVGLAVDNGNFVKLSGPLTSKMIRFQDQPVSLAVQGLYGCTSVVAVSKRGAWASHIFETPLFRPHHSFEQVLDENGKVVIDPVTHRAKRRVVWRNPTTNVWQPDLPRVAQLAKFRAGVLNEIRESSSPADDHRYGLNECRNSHIEAAIDADGHIFDDGLDTKVFILAPYEAVADQTSPNYDNEFPEGLKLRYDSDGNPLHDFYRADVGDISFNEQIRREISSYFGGNVVIETIPYAPRVRGTEAEKGDVAIDSNRGKALVQYQPAVTSDAESKAQWKVWFEGHANSVKTTSWDPLPAVGKSSLGFAAQRCTDSCENPASGSGVQGRGENDACASYSESSVSTTGSSTLAQSSTAQPRPTTTTSSLPSTPTASMCSKDADCQTGTFAGMCPATQSVICQDGKCVCDKGTPPSHTESETATTPTSIALPSSTTTQPLPSETAVITPIDQASARECWDAGDFRGHAEISSVTVWNFANEFCNKDEDRLTVLHSSVNMLLDSSYTRRKVSSAGINYDFAVQWKDGCTTEQVSQNVQFPADRKGETGIKCNYLLYDNHMSCINEGVGGKIQVGCLIYSFTGGKG